MHLSCAECVAVLKAQPSAELALGFHETKVGPTHLLPMGQIAITLIGIKQEKLAVDFIATLYEQGTQGDEKLYYDNSSLKQNLGDLSF